MEGVEPVVLGDETPGFRGKINLCMSWLKHRDLSEKKIHIPQTDGFSMRKLLAFMGPGFLISIAYIDPGNFATDISAGAQFNFTLVWILIFATILGFFLQALSARLGLVTEKDLSSVCREEYGDRTPLTIGLWLITESAIIASDIPEIIGTAFALNMLFGLPLWGGVLTTATTTMVFLALQYFGVRFLEIFTSVLVGIISICFIVEASMSPVNWVRSNCPTDWCSKFPAGECPTDYCGIFFGGFVPRLNGENLYSAISLLGAVVMPHNLFLHSALVRSRKIERTREKLAEASLYNWIECGLALGVSCVINIMVLSVAASSFYPSEFNNYSLEYRNPNLDDTQRLLGNFLGPAAKIVFAIALLASGQSSTLTGTYAGQFVMQGFIDLKLSLWLRNLVTRSIAILPSLIVAILFGTEGSTFLIILSSAILSFQLPFALIPLVKFTSSPLKMGPFANSKLIIFILVIITSIVILANMFLVFNTLYGAEGIISRMESKVVMGVVTTIIVIVVILYLIFLIYLLWRPVKHPGYNRNREDRNLITDDTEMEEKESSDSIND